jgi:hypothetical protein
MKYAVLALLVIMACPPVYNWSDALVDMAPHGRGADVAMEIVEFLSKARVRTDAKTGEFFDTLGKSIARFQISRLYESELMRDLPDGFKGVAFYGRQGAAHYHMGLTDADYGRVTLSNPGEFFTQMGLKKLDEKDRGGTLFTGTIAAKAVFGEFSHQNAAALTDGLLKVLDPENIKKMQCFKERQNRHIQNESLQVVHEYYKAFPLSTDILKQYVFIYHSLVRRYRHEGREYTRSHFRAMFLMDRLRADYPAIAAHLDSLRNFYTVEMSVLNPQGNTVLTLTFDSKDDFFSFYTYTAGGMVIPRDRNDMPVFDEAFFPSQMENAVFDARVNTLVNVYGLKFISQGIKGRIAFDLGPQKGRLEMTLVDFPKTLVTGRLGSVVPAWVIELAIPQNMGSIVDEFFETMINSREGKGAFIAMEWDESSKNGVDFSFFAQSDFLDNFYVRFAMAAANYQLRTTGQARQEAASFVEGYFAALIKDLNLYSAKGSEAAYADAAKTPSD